jgi:adenylate cyclase
MTFADDVCKGVDDVLETTWKTRCGSVVPVTEDVALSNGAVNVSATYLYADLAGSSQLAQMADPDVVGKVIRTYLNAATRTLRKFGGEIRSFDGDRVMAIFMGDDQASKAVNAALGINWAVWKVIRPKLEVKWPATLDGWQMKHGIGIDIGDAMIVRGGVRNNNDLVSIGRAPNVAAKLSDLRESPSIYITAAMWDALPFNDCFTEKADGDYADLWGWAKTRTIGGEDVETYGSTWMRRP